MPKRPPAAPVSVRKVGPALVSDENAQEQMLYRPVPQLDGPPAWKVDYPSFTPADAEALLERGETDPSFRQRKTYPADIRRFQNLMRTKRFVNFLPAGPICFDPDGMILNGKNRMTALAGMPDGTRTAFMCVYGVPRWMFKYFDTNRNRTIKDVYHIGNRRTKAQTPSVMKLALRYEECLMGLRDLTGWRHWSTIKDEHVDLDNFTERRDALHDWYSTGERAYRYAKLSLPAMTVFRFYQGIAWPDGAEVLAEFCDSLTSRDEGLLTDPAQRLRKWGLDQYYESIERINAKRELHLALMFRAFDQFTRKARIAKIEWAYGQPMTMPYHPGGLESALVSVKKALNELDNNV